GTMRGALQRRHRLPDRLTVGQRPLKPLIGVRFPVWQHDTKAAFRPFFLCVVPEEYAGGIFAKESKPLHDIFGATTKISSTGTETVSFDSLSGNTTQKRPFGRFCACCQ
ncbi:MAG: hypothetical protein RLZZ234_314, partial [Candidatus Parcubacteria bacterium]